MFILLLVSGMDIAENHGEEQNNGVDDYSDDLMLPVDSDQNAGDFSPMNRQQDIETMKTDDRETARDMAHEPQRVVVHEPFLGKTNPDISF